MESLLVFLSAFAGSFLAHIVFARLQKVPPEALRPEPKAATLEPFYPEEGGLAAHIRSTRQPGPYGSMKTGGP